MVRILIPFYSMYGHIYRMAQAAAEGVAAAGGEALLKRVPETLPAEVIAKMGATDAQNAMAQVPVCAPEDLAEAHGVLFGAPTRFGNMCGQMRQFLDGAGGLWARDALVGKPGGVFTSTGTQHGGQETTLVSFHFTLLHLGMVIVGLPYAFQGQKGVEEIKGCSPYGASTIAGGDGSRRPSAVELDGVRYQASYLTGIASKLKG